MTKQEAIEWLKGQRSTSNMIPSDDYGTWHLRIAQADAAMMQQAYLLLKAHNEGLISLRPEEPKAEVHGLGVPDSRIIKADAVEFERFINECRSLATQLRDVDPFCCWCDCSRVETLIAIAEEARHVASSN